MGLKRKYLFSKVRLITIAALASILLFAFDLGTAEGMRTVTSGGNPAIGITARRISDTIFRPVPPINSILLDEVYQVLEGPDIGTPLARFEWVGSHRLRVTLAANIVVSGNTDRILSADDVINSWERAASRRWDARWALRGVVGAGSPDGTISGLKALDERTIEIALSADRGPYDIVSSLESPALRLSVQAENGRQDGTGPFIIEQPNPDRTRLVSSATHIHGKPYVDEASLLVYSSADESVLDFGRGNLDALVIASSELDRFSGSSRAAPSRVEKIGDGLLVLVINPLKVPDINTRLALINAIDYQSLASVVLGKGAYVSSDFSGNEAESVDTESNLEEARRLYSGAGIHPKSIRLLVADDPAAIAAGGRLRANWESFGIPVEIIEGSGPLSLSQDAEVILLSHRIPPGKDGVLPQVLTLYDRNGWWEIVATALGQDNSVDLQRARNLDPGLEMESLGTALIASGLGKPLAAFDILFAPGPDIALVPSSVYPGPSCWRAYMGTFTEPVAIRSENGDD